MGRSLSILSLIYVFLAVPLARAHHDNDMLPPSSVPAAVALRLAEIEDQLDQLTHLLEDQAHTIVRQQEEIDSLRNELGLSLVESDLSGDSSFDPMSPAVSSSQQPSAEAHPAGWTQRHAYIDSADGNFKLEFGGRALLDYRAYQSDAAPPSTFLLRRARLKVEGTLFKNYEYEVETELTDSETALRDGYVNINYHPGIQVKLGQFKIPFSQEELISTKWLEFIENASLNNLVPGRSPGFQVHGELFGGVLEYQTGFFNGLGKLSINTSNTPELYVRSRLTPFRSNDLLSGFSFGGALGRGRHEGGESVVGETSSRSFVFFEPVPINGKVDRYNAEFSWLHRNWSIRGELDQSIQAREGMGVSGGDLPNVVGRGLYIAGSYYLTGEEKIEDDIYPLSPFLLEGGGLGAWELAFRYEHVRIDDGMSSPSHQAYTLGVNWWMTRFLRVSSNFIVELFDGRQHLRDLDDEHNLALLTRVQVIF
jgi:phosphate-selective porin OprO/OprP